MKRFLSLLCLLAMAAMARSAEAWPADVKEATYVSKGDRSKQPALVFTPVAKDKSDRRPLLVGLHTWGGDYRQAGGEIVYARWCLQNGWFFIHPNFRGQNTRPEALGSELAVEDIASAVEFMQASHPIDPDRIYLVGVSGGGHAALLLAGRKPGIWAGVSAWCGISDIKRWHQETKAASLSYYKDIEGACGGDPWAVAKAAQECAKRSPLTYLTNAATVNLDINAGVNDGRGGSVPFTQSLHAFNLVARPTDKIALTDIDSFYQTRAFPAMPNGLLDDAVYGSQKPLYRKISGNARVTIFKGGHEIVQLAALNWLNVQRRGKPPIWSIANPIVLDVDKGLNVSGK